MALYFTPRQVIQEVDLVALIKDQRDARVGQIARVGSISSDDSRAIVFTHLIFPDGEHGTWRTPSSLSHFEMARLPVDPPRLFYRHLPINIPLALKLAIDGERSGLIDFHRSYRALRNGDGDGYLHKSWRELFDVEFPLK